MIRSCLLRTCKRSRTNSCVRYSKEALEETEKMLNGYEIGRKMYEDGRIQLILDGHEHMEMYAKVRDCGCDML